MWFKIHALRGIDINTNFDDMGFILENAFTHMVLSVHAVLS